MNSSRISTDDPRLTAYALGELDAQAAAEVADLIERDPAAQQAVLGIRTVAEELKSALKDEPIEATAAQSSTPIQPSSGRVVRFPYYLLSAAAAAGFVVLFGLRPSTQQSSAAKSILSAVPVQPATSNLPQSVQATPASTGVAGDARHDSAIPDGFSDLKPAPFRDGGYRLGKSIASADSTTKGSLTHLSQAANEAAAISARPASQLARASRELNVFSPSLNYGIELMAPRLPALVYSSSSYAYETASGYSNVTGFPLMLVSPNVDTASHGDVQRYLRSGHLPPPNAVRIEELLNYFAYGQGGVHGDSSVAASLEVASAPWNPAHRLVRIGVKGTQGVALETDGTTVAKDVKLQVEFNPEQAKSYRLIGYEDHATTTKVASVDPEKVAGAELEAGHEVTALYEVVPVNVPEVPTIDGDPLRYGTDGKASGDPRHRELLTLKVRYRLPIIDVSRKMEIPLVDTGNAFAVASKDFKFSAAVAGFGMMLKQTPQKTATTYDDVLSWAPDAEKDDKSGKRNEFIDLVKKAKTATVE